MIVTHHEFQAPKIFVSDGMQGNKVPKPEREQPNISFAMHFMYLSREQQLKSEFRRQKPELELSTREDLETKIEKFRK